MKLVDMKRSKKEQKESMPKIAADSYGYGLRITLDEDQLDKLGLDGGDFKVGGYVTLQARACIKSVRENSTDEGGDNCSVELQLEKLGVEKSAASLKDAVDDGIDDADENES